jgi:perosamine synthetase
VSDTEQAYTSFEPGAAVAGGGIPLCVPELRGNEWRYVKECLDTGWVSSVGPFVEQLEKDVASYVGAARGVAMSTGTAALHIALLVAGVKPDDEVLVSDLTFIAPANAIRYANAWPVLIDAEPVYWQMDVARAIDFLEDHCSWNDGKLINKSTGRRVSAILPVHILGHPVDLDPLIEVAKKYKLAIVEDATESLGAAYRGRKVGNLAHNISQLGCFSFNGNKIITTGGGGMIVTNDPALAAKARYLSTQAKDDPIEYVHKETGFNYRLSNVQAALGCAQMELLDEFVAIKRGIAAEYAKAFAGVPGVTMMREASWARSIFWLNTVLIDADEYGEDSRALMKRLARRGIQARPLWQPLHRSEALSAVQSVGGEVADDINRRALSLPSSVGMTLEQVQEVIAAVSEPGRVTR